jgi:hypothetical protein
MKIKAFPYILALFLLGAVTSSVVNAQSSSGAYQFSLDDGYTKFADFDAVKLADGSTNGQLTFTDEAKVFYLDVDGTGDPNLKNTYPGYYIKVDFDDLVVDKNDAVMSGTIRDSDIRDFIGQRVLLTVEDNGDNTRVLDQLTWGIYKPVVRNWKPSDAELKDDPGVGLRWHATDAEVKDDRGIDMPRSEAIDTKSYPVSSYSFTAPQRSAGDIKVQP